MLTTLMSKSFMIKNVENLKRLLTLIFLLLLCSVSDALTIKERQAAELERLQQQKAEKTAKQQAEAKREQRVAAEEAKRRAKQAAEVKQQREAKANAKRELQARAKKQAAEEEANRLAEQVVNTGAKIEVQPLAPTAQRSSTKEKTDFACSDLDSKTKDYPEFDISPREKIHELGISFFDKQHPRYRPSGVCFPSFNNSMDTRGYGDERSFLKVKRHDAKDVPIGNFSKSVSVYPNDAVLMNAFIHNNGFDDQRTIATGVKTKISGFHKTERGIFVSPIFKESQTFTQTIQSSNAIPSEISDQITVSSAEHTPIRLWYYPGNMTIHAAMDINPKYTPVNYSEILTTGTVIGSLGQETSGNYVGDLSKAMYVRSFFFVEKVEYDLGILKQVKKKNESEFLNTLSNVKSGDEVTYRVTFSNLEYSNRPTVEAEGVAITDDFDEEAIHIKSIRVDNPNLTCSNDSKKIQCSYLKGLFPHEVVFFEYDAVINKQSNKNNYVEVSSNPNYDFDLSNNYLR